jgi:hypothetical protein
MRSGSYALRMRDLSLAAVVRRYADSNMRLDWG